jgi:hypothetical protein
MMLSIFACQPPTLSSRFGEWKKNPQLFGNFLGDSIMAFFNKCSALKGSAPPAGEPTPSGIDPAQQGPPSRGQRPRLQAYSRFTDNQYSRVEAVACREASHWALDLVEAAQSEPVLVWVSHLEWVSAWEVEEWVLA